MYKNRDLALLAEPRIRADGRLPKAFCIFNKYETQQEADEILAAARLVNKRLLMIVRRGNFSDKKQHAWAYTLYRINPEEEMYLI